MNYLKCLLAAFNAAGKSKAQVARDAGLNDLTLRHYMRGDYAVPIHRRAKLSQVFGVEIDWAVYASELAERQAERAEAKPAPAKQQAAGVAPRPAPAPAKPITLAQPKPQTAPPKAQPAPPRPIAAAAPAKPPQTAPAPVTRRFFGIPIIDDTAEAHA